MTIDEEKFLGELRTIFKVEAAEHLQAIADGLLELEKSPAPEAEHSIVATVFRAAHSLKGAARAVDFTEIESSCQSLEDVFSSWNRLESVPSAAALDTVHDMLDAISSALFVPTSPSVVSDSFATPSTGQPSARPDVPLSAPAPFVEFSTLSSEETVRVSVTKLNAGLVKAEEMLTAKLTIGQRAEDLRELGQRFVRWRTEWMAVESDARTLRRELDRPVSGRADQSHRPAWKKLLEFLEWNLDNQTALEGNVAALTRTAEQDGHVIGKLVDDLLEDSKKLLLLPFATLSALFPKLVRDLCRDLGKDVDFVVSGEEVEIDRRILEEMKDPLIHILRNCVDHGIETSEQRMRLGKPARATITLAVSSVDGNKVELLVSDDGTGIDIARVKESAIKHGFISPEEARQLGDTQTLALIFQPDVSTSARITRLSGRGLGLAIVREKVEKLGGTVTVTSQPHQGTSLRIVLPSTLATFRGILVVAAERLFVVPTLNVERVARVNADEIRTVEGRDTISISGRAVALVRLAEVLQLPPSGISAELHTATSVIVLGAGDNRIAFAIDAVLDEQEVLVKRLGSPLSRVRNVAGATVLGSGHMAPILNVTDLLKSARQSAGTMVRDVAARKPAEAAHKSILVVEDSITSRMLLKGILESAGYTVSTAVDGMDAFSKLRAETYNLVVSDVEMPRLDGFALTTRIRADRKLGDLPVILVTALESREDRERGIEVGANAYIIKSSLEQSNLLAAVRRLI